MGKDMKLYYDLHIHTALSPCGDDDNTPNNIVNMAMLKELDVIAITDHNSVFNYPACKKIADNLGILVIPGMELTTSEDIHVLIYFYDYEYAIKFNEYVFKRMVKVPNKEAVFGKQQILDENDEEIGKIDNLLILTSKIGIYELERLSKEYNFVYVPAHIDKMSNSTIAILGFLPEDLGNKSVEVSPRAKQEFFSSLDLSKYRVIRDSDSHYLGDMSERENYIEVNEKSIKKVLDYLQGK